MCTPATNLQTSKQKERYETMFLTILVLHAEIKNHQDGGTINQILLHRAVKRLIFLIALKHEINYFNRALTC